MNYDWRSIVHPHLIQTSEHADYLDSRVSEMSPKEWRTLKAAFEMWPQDDLAGVIALTERMNCFTYYFPADGTDEAGYLLAKQNYGVRSDVLPFIDPSEVFKEYQSTYGGVLVDGAFVSGTSITGINHIDVTADSIRDGNMPVDKNWSAKLHIEGPSGDTVWLRLPDYEETTGEQDEVATALFEVDADSLDECTLLEAKCIFPQIDLMKYEGSLTKLAFDASNLGFALFEQDRKVEHFDEILRNALDFEQCDDINFAIDIISNIDCYDFVPDASLRSTAEKLLPKRLDQQPAILAAFNYEAFAANHLRSIGMYEVDGGFFMRNDKEFHYDYSLPPDQKAEIATRNSLEHRLNLALEKCWRDYKAMMVGEDPEWLFNRAEDIAATEAAYGAFCHSSKLTNETMEKLLQFENPLEILRDAWARGTGHEDERHMTSRIQDMLDNPQIGESYDQLPEYSGRPVEQEREQQMGGYDG